jgi:hypothetical protein
MSVLGILGAITPVAKILLNILEKIDPKTREFVRRRKALDWAEKFILTYDKIVDLETKASYTELSKKEQRSLSFYRRKIKWFGKQFFDMS